MQLGIAPEPGQLAFGVMAAGFLHFLRRLGDGFFSMQGSNKTVMLSADSPIAQIFYGK